MAKVIKLLGWWCRCGKLNPAYDGVICIACAQRRSTHEVKYG